MKLIDIVLITLILGYCIYVAYKSYKNKNTCTHSCSTCMSKSCQLSEYTKQIQQIREGK